MKNLAQVFDGALTRAYRDLTAAVVGLAAIALALATFAQREIAWGATSPRSVEIEQTDDYSNFDEEEDSGTEKYEGGVSFNDKAYFIDPESDFCSIFDLYQQLKSLPIIHKDEYETDFEFERRQDDTVRSSDDETICGRPLSSRFAIEIHSFRCKYNANTAKFALHLTRVGYTANSVVTHATGEKKDRLRGTTTSSVGFGVTSEKTLCFDFELPTPLDAAKDLRDKIGAALVFTNEPRRSGSDDDRLPTRDNGSFFQYDNSVKYSFVSSQGGINAVYGKDLEMWVYNKDNGDVLLKQPLAIGSRPSYRKEYDIFNAPQKEEPEKSENDILGFNELDNKIPKSYRGVDPLDLTLNLKEFWSELDKDEFESIVEYNERRKEFLDRAQDANLYGDFTLGSRFAIVIDGSKIGQVYDAKNQFLVFRLDGRGYNARRTAGRGQKNTKAGSFWIFLGRYRELSFAYRPPNLALKALDDIVTSVSKDRDLTPENGLIFFHPCVATDAQDLKGHVNALIVFSIDPKPYCVFDPIGEFKFVDHNYYSPNLYGSFVRPTPFESYWRLIDCTIYAKDVVVWFYDNRTGEVFKKSVLTRGYVPGSKRENRESTQGSSEAADDDEDAEVGKPMKNWYELLAESVDAPASWERKKPTIIVPDDVATLPEAVSRAQSGDVIMLRQSSTPYTLGLTSTSSATGLMLDKPIAIVGETGRASDVVLQIGVRESVFVETKGAMFKGITLSCGPLGLEKYSTPIVTVGNSGYATFKNCEFHGAGVARSIGAQFSGQESRGVFWKCVFRHFAESGVLAKDASAVKLEYCEFLDENHYGVASETNASILLARCHFVDNIVCICANSGGGCKVVESRAEVYKRRADISPGSRNKYEELDCVFRNR